MHSAQRAHRYLMGTLRLVSLQEAAVRNAYAMTSARGHPDGQAPLCPSYRLNVNTT